MNNSILNNTFSYIENVIIPILEGAQITLSLFAITLALSIPLGLLLAIGNLSKNIALRRVIKGYITLFRGTPLLLQLFFFYFGFGNISIKTGISLFNLSRFTAASIAFTLNYAAYFAEIFRAGIQSIDKGQYEGAKVLGLSYAQTMKGIILPQVIRVVLPPMSNEMITLIKDTALVYAIALSEVMRITKTIVSGQVILSPFIVAALFYLFMTFIITKISDSLESKYSYYL